MRYKNLRIKKRTCLYFGFILAWFGFLVLIDVSWTSIICYIAFIITPVTIRAYQRNRLIQHIEKMRIALTISIEEVRKYGNLGRYDLIDWKWNESFVSDKQLHLINDKLEKI